MAELGSGRFLLLSADHWLAVVEDVRARHFEEACGLIAGSGGISTAVYPLENVLHSPTRYRMDPGEQIRTLWKIEEKGWDLLAIYHSHPGGPPYPSETDVVVAGYPESYHLILVPGPEVVRAAAFLIQNGRVETVPIRVGRKEDPDAGNATKTPDRGSDF